MLAIIAGFLIAMGGIVNLTVGGIAGALFFSLGLITIVTFKYSLFTGKAGLLATGDIDEFELAAIWIGNFIGAFGCSIAVSALPNAQILIEKASNIVSAKSAQLPLTNLILGIFCGILMYIAVTGFQKTNNYLLVIAPVAFFILCGFNHCVADMFYVALGANDWKEGLYLIPTTVGNLIGTNLLPLLDRRISNVSKM